MEFVKGTPGISGMMEPMTMKFRWSPIPAVNKRMQIAVTRAPPLMLPTILDRCGPLIYSTYRYRRIPAVNATALSDAFPPNR